MSNIPHFAAYAGAFEEAFETDQWEGVAGYFTDDAVYEVGLAPPLGGVFEGPAEITAYFKRILDTLDRRFATREIALMDGPHEEGDHLWLRGSATYTAEGVPDLVLVLEEHLWFEGPRIRRLEDRYTPEMFADAAAYLRAHGDTLGIEERLDDPA